MKIKFLKDQFIECFGFDEDGEQIMEVEKVLQDEVFDVDILDDDVRDESIQIQFGNGSVSFIDRECIEKISE
jgi:hypothetical protein